MTLEPTALLAERVQNICIYTVYIDIFCTRSNPGKMVPGKSVPGKNGPRKNGPRKNGPPGNSETKNLGVGVEHRGVCVWNLGMLLIYENSKLDNKPKTRKQKITG